jgi:hypothetical protein
MKTFKEIMEDVWGRAPDDVFDNPDYRIDLKDAKLLAQAYAVQFLIPKSRFQDLLYCKTTGVYLPTGELCTAILFKDIEGIVESLESEQVGWAGNLVQCDVCAHKWVAVYPADLELLECPNCGGRVKYTVIPEDDEHPMPPEYYETH